VQFFLCCAKSFCPEISRNASHLPTAKAQKEQIQTTAKASCTLPTCIRKVLGSNLRRNIELPVFLNSLNQNFAIWLQSKSLSLQLTSFTNYHSLTTAQSAATDNVGKKQPASKGHKQHNRKSPERVFNTLMRRAISEGSVLCAVLSFRAFAQKSVKQYIRSTKSPSKQTAVRDNSLLPVRLT
jgi:hypothetical protein